MAQGVFVCVGQSGAGKTTISQKLCLASGRHLHYVVNNTTPDKIYNKSFVDTTFENALSLSNCSIIFEDCIRLTNAEIDILLNMVNKRARHFNVTPLFIHVHSILRNSIYPVVRQVPFVIFFNTCSAEDVKHILHHAGCFSKEKVQDYVLDFASHTERCFYLLNIKTKTFSLSSEKELQALIPKPQIDIDLSPEEQFAMELGIDKKQLLDRAETILRLGPNSEKSIPLFQIITSTFRSSLDYNDYCLKLEIQNSGKIEKFSIIDLCNVASSETKIPDRRSNLLFKFITEQIKPPECLIKNRVFRSVLLK